LFERSSAEFGGDEAFGFDVAKARVLDFQWISTELSTYVAAESAFESQKINFTVRVTKSSRKSLSMYAIFRSILLGSACEAKIAPLCFQQLTHTKVV
jgi:hypothetical protein